MDGFTPVKKLNHITTILHRYFLIGFGIKKLRNFDVFRKFLFITKMTLFWRLLNHKYMLRREKSCNCSVENVDILIVLRRYFNLRAP